MDRCVAPGRVSMGRPLANPFPPAVGRLPHRLCRVSGPINRSIDLSRRHLVVSAINSSVLDNGETQVCLSEGQLLTVKEQFEAADLDGNGKIDMFELRGLLESMQCGSVYVTEHWLPDDETGKMMEQYDKDGDGALSFDEFTDLVQDGVLLDGQLLDYEEAFNAADTSRNGTVGFSELSKLFNNLGSSMSDEKLTEVMNRYDVDRSGQIEFNEFLLMFRDQLLDLNDVLSYIRLQKSDGPPPSLDKESTLIDVEEGGVTTIYSSDELDEILASNMNRLVILLGGLTWCRPCKAATRPFQKLADRYRDTIFLKFYGNANSNTKTLFKDRLQAKATPAFFFFKNGEVVHTHTGAQREKLENFLRKHLNGQETEVEPVYV